MDRSLFNDADEESIAATERAIADLQKLGATIVDPGPNGALLQKYIDKYAPSVLSKLFINRFPEAFPVDASGKPTADHIATLVEMYLRPVAHAGRRHAAQPRAGPVGWRVTFHARALSA